MKNIGTLLFSFLMLVIVCCKLSAQQNLYLDRKLATTAKFDFKKFHFAMNGNWTNNENEIHNLNNEDKVSKWLNGLLNHIILQLKYV